MRVRDVESGFFITLERGEKVLQTLTEFCAERGIQGGVLQGIGAVKHAEVGYYDLSKREYFFKTFPEDREVASMTGNIALVYLEETQGVDGPSTPLRAGKPFIHAHVVLSAMDDGLSCVGAHLKEAEVAVTLEVFLTPFPAALSRKYDEDIGLKLLSL